MVHGLYRCSSIAPGPPPCFRSLRMEAPRARQRGRGAGYPRPCLVLCRLTVVIPIDLNYIIIGIIVIIYY